jgi:hypothetical protein
VQVRGCEEGESLDDVIGLCVASEEGDRGRGGDGGLGNGVEAGADATGERESLGAAAVG